MHMHICIYSEKYIDVHSKFSVHWNYFGKKSGISDYQWHLRFDFKNTVCLWNQQIWNIPCLLLTDDGGSTSASVDFTIGDENLNKGLPVLFGEVICT